ncbi:hypothetical protein C8Q75DRAFT_96038 [Abortiporus biennis]|nr:hypothetical protein C8Q75DRAFT_96038 [Abortiporus biennis]
MLSFKSTFATLAVVGAVSVQAITVSDQCQSTLTQLVLSPSSQCLNAQALIGLATTSADASLVGPINNWLTGLCSQAACSNDTLSAIVTNITSGCSSDLQSAGVGTVNTQQLIPIVQQAYPTVRKIACLTDTQNSKGLCVTETLTSLEGQVGTLSTNAIQSLAQQISQGNLPNVSSSTICTDCTKAAYNIINTDYPSLINSNANSSVAQTCGSSFTDGSNPSTVVQGGSNNTANAAASEGILTATNPVGFIFTLMGFGSVFVLAA